LIDQGKLKDADTRNEQMPKTSGSRTNIGDKQLDYPTPPAVYISCCWLTETRLEARLLAYEVRLPS